MKILDKTWLSYDEECNSSSKIAEQLEKALDHLKFDTYNEQYVIHVTVYRVDERAADND